METPQLPKWHSAERRFEALAKFKAYVLTREGAVITAIVAVGVIALATGMFYLATQEGEPSRAEQEADRQRMKDELRAGAIPLEPEIAEQKQDAMEASLQQNQQAVPKDAARSKEELFRRSLGEQKY